MLFSSKIVRRFFAAMMLIIVVMFVAFYAISVPMIQSKVYEIELNSSRAALNNVFDMANKMHANLESHKEQAIQAHKDNLVSLINLTGAYIDDAFDNGIKRGLSEQTVREDIFHFLRNHLDGNYIWVVDYDNNILSHPDERFNGFNANDIKDQNPRDVVNLLIDKALTDGEGFVQYPWYHVNKSQSSTKLSFVKGFPEYGFVIGSGVYLDDVDKQVEHLRLGSIEKIRDALSKIVIAKTGYIFIFDQEGQLIAHPNPLIDQTNSMGLINPVTQGSILQDMMNVADSGQELHYKWDKTDDPGNYIYDKISLTRSLDGFGWYISSTAYVEELQSSANLLSSRIIYVALLSLLLASILGLWFIGRIARPIQALAATAKRVHGGDLSASTNIQRDDELGVLAATFDEMVGQLRSNIHQLDSTVQERSQALGELEQRQRLILDALPVFISYFDKELDLLFANKAFRVLFSLDESDLIGKNLRDIVDAQTFAPFAEELQRCLGGENINVEREITIKQTTLLGKHMLLPHRNAQGETIGMVILSIDIGAEKDAEKQLMELQRIHVTSQLAGGLAHDYNNLLTIIIGNLLIAEDQNQQNPKLLELLKPAIRASRRGALITDKLLTFSRRQSLRPTVVKAHKIIEDCIELVQAALPTSITVALHKTVDEPCIYVDSPQLENALINLALNAKDAIGERDGQLIFRLSQRRITTEVFYDELVPQGEYVEIQIIDNGCGFSPQALLCAYEPFFTTKSSGKGSGLGLSMIYGFIKQSLGYIHIVSEEGSGAKISLLLPQSHAEAEEAADESRGLSEPQGYDSRLVLLAEDEDDLRSVIRYQLMDMGFIVIEACDADEAEQIILSNTPFELFVSDISMPGRLNGYELAQLARERQTNCNITLMSGYAMASKYPEDEKFTVLRKPFEHTELAQALGIKTPPAKHQDSVDHRESVDEQ